MDEPGEVTLLLEQMKRGGEDALPKLMPLVYNELRRLAAHFLREERAGHTLQPTALVHEAYLRLVDQNHAGWQNRAQFMSIAARVMRRVLVDYARQRLAAKRGGDVTPITREIDIAGPDLEEMLAVDEALARLNELDPQQAVVVEMRYFGGLTVEETAETLTLSTRTVKRDWAMAKAWLRLEFSSSGSFRREGE